MKNGPGEIVEKGEKYWREKLVSAEDMVERATKKLKVLASLAQLALAKEGLGAGSSSSESNGEKLAHNEIILRPGTRLTDQKLDEITIMLESSEKNITTEQPIMPETK
ncbi:MAG: hypothetical protein ABI716_01250 [Candidatus Saccharibacteria bacterium]